MVRKKMSRPGCKKTALVVLFWMSRLYHIKWNIFQSCGLADILSLDSEKGRHSAFPLTHSQSGTMYNGETSFHDKDFRFDIMQIPVNDGTIFDYRSCITV